MYRKNLSIIHLFNKKSFIFSAVSFDYKAEQTCTDAGKVVVILHAVCRQCGSVDDVSHAVLDIQAVNAGSIE